MPDYRSGTKVVSRGNKGRLSFTNSWLPVACSALYLSIGSVSAAPMDLPSGKTVSDRVSDSGTDSTERESYGLPIFRIDEKRWFDVTIDLPDQPENASEVEEMRNREVQQGKDQKQNDIFPDPNDMMRDIRFRFHYRFD